MFLPLQPIINTKLAKQVLYVGISSNLNQKGIWLHTGTKWTMSHMYCCGRQNSVSMEGKTVSVIFIYVWKGIVGWKKTIYEQEDIYSISSWYLCDVKIYQPYKLVKSYFLVLWKKTNLKVSYKIKLPCVLILRHHFILPDLHRKGGWLGKRNCACRMHMAFLPYRWKSLIHVFLFKTLRDIYQCWR